MEESGRRLVNDLVNERPRPKFEVMIWGCISWFGPGLRTVTAVDGNINAIKYQDFLEDHLCNGQLLLNIFLKGGIFFKMIMPQCR